MGSDKAQTDPMAQSGDSTVLEGKCDPSCRMAEKGQTLESIHQAWQGL